MDCDPVSGSNIYGRISGSNIYGRTCDRIHHWRTQPLTRAGPLGVFRSVDDLVDHGETG